MGVVEELEGLLHDQPQNPLRHHQVQAYEEEQARLDKIVHAPPYVEGDRSVAFERSRKIARMLQDQAPRKIEDTGKGNRIHRLCAEVLETVIKPAMLSRATMRRNPPGAVDAYMRRENSPIVKRAKLAWKRARRALDPTNDSKDFTNLELARADGSGSATASFMVDAQIPGHFAMSPQAKDRWPLGEPTIQTAISHLQPETEEALEEMAEAKRHVEHDRREMFPPAPENAIQLPCECGCGKMLINPGKKRYVNKSHRVRASLLRRKRALEEKPINLAPRAPEPAAPAGE